MSEERGAPPADEDPPVPCPPMQDEERAAKARCTVPRLSSIDAVRGLVMLLIFGEALRSCVVASSLPTSGFWRALCEQQSHAEWAGWHLHDLIQPTFIFLVGVCVTLSIVRRRARGDTDRELMKHAALRAALLIALGVTVLSMSPPRTIHWRFDDTLTQIGLGYAVVFALALAGPRWWIGALVAILLADWAAFAAYPVAGPGHDFAAFGVTQEWLSRYAFSGFESHWQKHANAASAFDAYFLSLFPGNEGYYSQAGLTTLNFVPAMGTMILGLWAGHVLITMEPAAARLRALLLAGAVCVTGGLALDATGVCPIVKPLWTPSWVLFSGGLCLAATAAAHWLIDLHGPPRAVFVLTVVGANSLAAYILYHAYHAFAWGTLRRVFGSAPFAIFGPAYEPFLYGLGVMCLLWLVLYALNRMGWNLRL